MFNTENRLDYILDRNGNRISLYYSDGLLDSIHDDQGDSLYLAYDDALLVGIYDHTGTIASYGYDGNGQLETVSYPNNDTIFYSYVVRGLAEHLLSEIVNSDGNARYYDYDTLGRAITTYSGEEKGRYDIAYTNICNTCPQGMEAEAVSGSENSSVYHSMWGPGHNRRFVYEIADPECGGCGEQLAYDADGNIARITYKNGAVDSFAYDDRGNMTMRIRGLGSVGERTTWIDYSPGYNLPVEMRTPSLFGGERMDVTDYFRDANGNLDSLVEIGWIDSDNQYHDVTAFTYNSYGQVTEIDGPRTDVGDVILFKYNDDTKYLDSMQRPNGDFTEFGPRDRFGKPLWVKDGNGIITRYVYDDRGRIEKVIEHSGTSDSAMTQYTYDCSGNITTVRFPAGNYLNYTYDNSNRLISVSNTVNDSITYTYDDMNNLSKMEIKNSFGVVHRYEEYDYDATNRLTHIYNPDSTYTQFHYDSLDNIVWRRDALGNYIYYAYDTLNRMDMIVYMNDGDSIITAIAYNNRDQITEITDPDGNTYAYTYDDRGNLTSDECAATGLTQYACDGAGNVRHVITALDDDIYYDYDVLNRLEEIQFPDSAENISYIYDETRTTAGMGYLYKENTPACTTKYLYDAFGQITTATQTVDEFRYTTGYQYTKNGDIAQIITPSNMCINYFYDGAQRPILVSRGTDSGGNVPVIDSIEYAPFGGPKSYVHGNGIKTHISYTSRYLVDNIHTTGASVMNRTYSYDAVGNVQSFVDSLDNSYSQSFEYDDLGRLKKAISSSFSSDSTAYTYYDNGNRHEKIMGEETTTYIYVDNRLIALSGADTADFDYDNLGDVIADMLDTLVHSYTYNYAGRLSIVGPDDLARYYYNGSGQRIKKVSGNVNRVYSYDQWGNLICETDTSRGWIADYVYISGWPVAKIIKYAESQPHKGEGGGGGGGGAIPTRDPYYYHNDHLGTPQILTHSGKFVYWKAYYYPFGTIYDETANIENDLRFPGQYADEETGLNYNWHRYYAPTLGRYYQAEPMTFVKPYAHYQYVLDNPISTIDPTGLSGRRNWWTKFRAGYYFGTGYGEEAVDYYAHLWTNPDTPWYIKDLAHLGGLYSALWTEETWIGSLSALVGARQAGSCVQEIMSVPSGAPKAITGFTKHGINQAISRNVTPQMLNETVTGPKQIIRIVDATGRISYRYIGEKAIVVLNKEGEVITAWRLF